MTCSLGGRELVLEPCFSEKVGLKWPIEGSSLELLNCTQVKEGLTREYHG